ncbi:MAG: prepilin peptidase, partial [Cyanobacteria bacterium J06631_9]
MDTIVPFLIVFILGTAVGSFLNVVVYRLPEGLSLLYPPSRCPK